MLDQGVFCLLVELLIVVTYEGAIVGVLIRFVFGFVVVERSEISLNEIRDFDISMGP